MILPFVNISELNLKLLYNGACLPLRISFHGDIKGGNKKKENKKKWKRRKLDGKIEW